MLLKLIDIGTFLSRILRSNRVKVALFSVLLGFFEKFAPGLAPSPETLEWIYMILLALIGADTFRPVDPEKQRIGMIGLRR